MAHVQVYELAKEVGTDSKVIMDRLNALGYPVRSASATIQANAIAALHGESVGSSQRKTAGAGDTFKCPCCGLLQNPHFNQFDIRDRVCASGISRQGDGAELKRTEKHIELLRERLAVASQAANVAYIARTQYKEKMHFAYDSRERAIGYLAKINDQHELRVVGDCSCGKRNCQTADLLYQPWPQGMIKKLDDLERRRRETGHTVDDDWDYEC